MFIDWVTMVDQIFWFKHTSPQRKIDAVVPRLLGYAQIWWFDYVCSGTSLGLHPLDD